MVTPDPADANPGAVQFGPLGMTDNIPSDTFVTSDGQPFVPPDADTLEQLFDAVNDDFDHDTILAGRATPVDALSAEQRLERILTAMEHPSHLRIIATWIREKGIDSYAEYLEALADAADHTR